MGCDFSSESEEINLSSKKKFHLPAGHFKSWPNNFDIFIYSRKSCAFCRCAKVKANLLSKQLTNDSYNIDNQKSTENEIETWLKKQTGQGTFPFVFLKGKFIGGYEEFVQHIKAGNI